MASRRTERRVFGERWRLAATAALLAGGLLLAALAGGPGLSAADKAEPAKGALPADLQQVPPDAVAFTTVRVADVWNHDILKAVRDKLGKDGPDPAGEFSRVLGVVPADVARLSLFITEVHTEQPPVIVVATEKPYDRAKVLAAAGPGVKEEQYKGRTLHVGERDGAFVFIDDKTFVAGTPAALRGWLDRPAVKEGGLTPALHLAAEKHLAVGGLNPVAIDKEIGDKVPPEGDPYKPLLKANSAALTLDLGDKAEAVLRVEFAKEADAKDGEKAVRAALDAGKAGLALGIQALGSQGAEVAKTVDLLKQAEAGLKAAAVQQKGTTVQATVGVKTDLPLLAATALEAVQKVRDAAQRLRSQNNLKQLALAMHNYLDKNGSFPPNAVYSKDGKALLSWRVLLLPYLEADDLYKEFKLDEPWDSEHNKKLLAKMPKVFEATGPKPGTTDTVYQAFVGDGTIFEGKKGVAITDITDGTSNTLMFVEAAKAVPWTKPEDLPFDPAKPLPKLGGVSPGGFNAAFCDGSVRFLSNSIAEETLKALITRAGGEVINLDQ